MMQRCNNPKATNYKYYGAVGIKVCERWHTFDLFLEDMGQCDTSDLTLDRIDNSRGYEPGNCRWVSQAEQNKNRPRHAVMLTHNGVTKSVSQWAIELDMPANNISMRLNRLGWSVERTLTTPKQVRGKRAA